MGGTGPGWISACLTMKIFKIKIKATSSVIAGHNLVQLQQRIFIRER